MYLAPPCKVKLLRGSIIKADAEARSNTESTNSSYVKSEHPKRGCLMFELIIMRLYLYWVVEKILTIFSPDGFEVTGLRL